MTYMQSMRKYVQQAMDTTKHAIEMTAQERKQTAILLNLVTILETLEQLSNKVDAEVL